MLKRYLTLFILAIAGYFTYVQYTIHTADPWTRDGQVRASIVLITPQVTGEIVNVLAEDNAQVDKGQLLFEIDESVYNVDLKKAQAAYKQAQVALTQVKDQQQRSINLEKGSPGAVPILTLNNLANAVEDAKARLEVTRAAVNNAKLNLFHTKVYAPADGYISNFNLREGSHVVANKPVVALIDKHSFWVDAFFKETDLFDVQIGDQVEVVLMMHGDEVIKGEVESIDFGIAKQDGKTGNNLLPIVNPNFQWIRLAQRIPVRIKLTSIPDSLQLRVGISASVKILTNTSQ